MSLKRDLHHAKTIAKKDLRELSKVPHVYIALTLFPLIMVSIIAWGFGGDIDHIKVAFVDEDSTAISIDLMEEFQSSKILDVIEVNGVDQARKMLEDERVFGVIVIPEGFGKNFEESRYKIDLYLDGSRYTIMNIISREVERITSAYASGISLEILSKYHEDPEVIFKPVDLQKDYLFGGNSEYLDFIIPGGIAFAIAVGVMLRMGDMIVRERERGTIQRILITPATNRAIILGKTLSSLAIDIPRAFIVTILAFMIFPIYLRGSFFSLMVIEFLEILIFIGIGFMISSRIKSMAEYIPIALPLTIPPAFISGVFFPIEALPWILNKFAYLLPLTYVAHALREITIKGYGLSMIMTDVTALSIYAIIAMGLGVLTFQREV
ncbi:MAG: ABC transporter permease [Candidatus Hydrothermarchaeota archaeon]